MIIGLGIGIPFIRNYVSSVYKEFSPIDLFTTGVNGAWYDPSDFTTLFRDAAGTTPVTAVEQPVGLMLDKRDTTYSTYFDGNGDYLTAPYSTSAFDWWTSDSTIEAWVYASSFQTWESSGGFPSLVGNMSPTTAINYWSFGPVASNKVTFFYWTGVSHTVTSTESLILGAWNHIAATITSSGIKVWVNGIGSTASAISGTPLTSTSVPLTIGQQPASSVNGYISNLRIVKGTALYTANFTPPTAPLTPVAGTSLLTCGTTWSGNPAITNNGNARADKLNPFKTGTGNHAFNPSGNSANFPVLSARYNLLTKTEQFDDGVWTKQAGTTVSPTKVAAPDGTLTAFSVTGNGTSGVYQAISGSVSIGQSTRSVYLRSPSGAVSVGIKDPAKTQGTATCNLTASWQRFTLTETTTPTAGLVAGIWIFNIPVAGIEIAWPDLRVANDALNQPAYQRVNTATDYDTVGFKPYLRFNGTNQWLQTNSIDFTYGDKMFVCAGVRKLSDAATGIVYELSTATESVLGGFYLVAPNNGAGASYQISTRSSGGGNMPINVTGIPAPITNVSTSLYDLSVSSMAIRFNGITNTTRTGGAGGVFGNYPLYLGARAGSSLWFNGRLYPLVIAGKQASAAEITNTETFINQKTGAY